MALSRIAQMHADEIRMHDWSDAHVRLDRAGHNRSDDRSPSEQLPQQQAGNIRVNAMWVTAQVLAYLDPNFDILEFAKECGITGLTPGILRAGQRGTDGKFQRPGTTGFDQSDS